jgi:ankyrin repeat protein
MVEEKSSDTNTKDFFFGHTPLMMAAQNGNVSAVQTLLDKGVDVNERNEYGDTALTFATLKGHTDCVQSLIDKGAEVNAKTKEGGTPLMLAAAFGYTDIVWALLNNGAELNTKTETGKTALMKATENGHTSIVKTLLVNGAEVNVKDNDCLTALMLAEENGNPSIINILLDNGAIEENASNKHHSLKLQNSLYFFLVPGLLIIVGAILYSFGFITESPPEKSYSTTQVEELPYSDSQYSSFSPANGTYSVQVGSFNKKSDAELLSKRLRKKTYDTYVVLADLGEKGIWYRVRVGMLREKEDAEKLLQHLAREEKLKGLIFKNNKGEN